MIAAEEFCLLVKKVVPAGKIRKNLSEFVLSFSALVVLTMLPCLKKGLLRNSWVLKEILDRAIRVCIITILPSKKLLYTALLPRKEALSMLYYNV